MAAKSIFHLEKKIFEIKDKEEFKQLALEVFKFQYHNTPVYREYCDLLNTDPSQILSIEQIPFLPISAFKTRRVIAENHIEKLTFKSSGTTTQNRSSHLISYPEIYQESLNLSFNSLIGNPKDYLFFSLLPGYEENKESSLIYMLNRLSKDSKDGLIHRFPNDLDKLTSTLLECNNKGQKTILFGVSFALLDLADSVNVTLPLTSILETGGMKGKRKEIIRAELHSILQTRLNPGNIISEYGMTEMLSQAYAVNSEWFMTPNWLKILIRDVYDPLSVSTFGSGALNIIDLANIYSCSFVASDDLGSLKEDGSFSVLGRFDHSDIRGCNLLYSN